MRRLRHRPHGRGQTLVEFALILPIFILLLVGIFDFGRAIYAYNTISNASREGMRLAIVDQNMTAIENEAVAHATSLGIGAGQVDVEFRSPDLSTTCASPYEVGCVAVVTVRYQYQAATPIIGNLVGIINMESKSRQGIEYVYQSP
jgi:Flp pilus assembly protein TadG